MAIKFFTAGIQGPPFERMPETDWDSLRRRTADFLRREGIPFLENEPLLPYTSFRMGGPASLMAKPETADHFRMLQNLLRENNLPHFFLGGGSNILVSDQPFRGLIIHSGQKESYEILDAGPEEILVRVNASARAPWFGKKISAMGYTGLEFLTTIPGQVGGAVIQNAGCYGYEWKDIGVEVEIVREGRLEILSNAQCLFSYRNSIFKANPEIFILRATIRLPAGKPEEIQARMDDFRDRRMRSQPRNRRSAGSIFKNPPLQISAKKAWQLIDEAGLRGIRRGQVEISSEHCNFIVNLGDGRAEDAWHLIRLAEQEVKAKTGIELEKEVILVGDFPS